METWERKTTMGQLDYQNKNKKKKDERPVNKISVSNLELELDVGGKKASEKDGLHWAENEMVAYRGWRWRQKLG